MQFLLRPGWKLADYSMQLDCTSSLFHALKGKIRPI